MKGCKMAQRLTRKLTDVAAEVEKQIKAHYNITQRELDSFRVQAQAKHTLGYNFPESKMVPIPASKRTSYDKPSLREPNHVT